MSPWSLLLFRLNNSQLSQLVFLGEVLHPPWSSSSQFAPTNPFISCDGDLRTGCRTVAPLTRAEGLKSLTQHAGHTAFHLRRYYTQVVKIKINALNSSVLSIIYMVLNMFFCMSSSRIITQKTVIRCSTGLSSGQCCVHTSCDGLFTHCNAWHY